MKFTYVLILFSVLLMGNYLQAQEGIWTQRSERKVADSEIYRTLQFNETKAKRVLEESGGQQVLELPLPDGRNVEFTLSKNQVMAPELAAKFPMIKSFNGISKDGRYSAKVDFNGTALYAAVRTEKGIVYIDPDKRANPAYYKSYYTREYKNSKDQLPVFIEPELPNSGKSVRLQRVLANNRANAVNTVSGSQLRRYRIAIAANSNYSSFHGGTTESVLSAMVTTMNRVNGLYENDLAITMELIADNDQLIFLTAATDPYNGLSDPGDFLNANTTVLNNAVGVNSYDIGHVFTTSSGGVASLGSVCTSRKALGTTGIGSPIGDAFDVDFVAHEIGHQFSGNHTFNGTQGFCGSGGQRVASTAYEPGSGSTIQAYAGICGSDNLQNNSDAFFHAISLEEIIAFSTVGAGNSCATISPSGNTPPTVIVDETVYTIPVNTPFMLAAQGSDVNNDDLTYSWEQFDLGPGGSPDNPVGNAPLFRAFTPTSDSFRIFPRLQNIINGTTIFGEQLPSIEREMNFRVVVRDNNPLGGGIVTGDVKINVEDGEAFTVTSQDATGTSYIGGSTQQVTWNVAGTDDGNIDVANVKISLSTDGGQNFDQVLLESTENDGLAEVRMPEVVTNNARIKVEAVNNIFFNVNSTNFSITQATQADYTIRVNPIPLEVCTPENAIFEVFVDGFGGFNETVSLSIDGLGNDVNIDIGNASLLAGQSTSVTISNTTAIQQSPIMVIINASSPTAGNQTKQVELRVLDGAASGVDLIFPEDNATSVSTLLEFNWADSELADNYNFELATDENFQNIVYSENEIDQSSLILDFELDESVRYFWRVSINNQCGTGGFTTGEFRTEAFETTTASLTNLGLQIIPAVPNTVTSTLTISEDVTVDDINFKGLDISHTYISDLTVVLQSPAGTRVTLFSEICNDEENILTNFDDESFNTVIACPPTGNITYKPQNPLSAFDGESSLGDWILEVSDGASQDGGSLNAWGLEIRSVSRQLALNVNSTGPTEVELSWDVLNTAETITGYEVDAKLAAELSFTKIADVGESASSVIVSDLLPESTYQFRVRPVFGSEVGEYSNVVEILTVPAAPENLSVSLNNLGLLVITWTDNLENGLGFVLETATESAEEFVTLETLSNDESIFVYDDFNSGERLFFRIKAFNESGDSPYSEIVELVISSVSDLLESVNLYPNPGNDMVRLQGVVLSEISTVEISDLTGKSVAVDISREDPTNYVLDTSPLRSGIYLIRLQNGRANKTFRWVKK
ncbi:MAG: reprolysin-like metallopeptidase [Bacteroidota bacterium]